MKNKPILLVDLDDTLIDFIPALCEWHNEAHGLRVKPDDITDWNLFRFFSGLTPEEVFNPIRYSAFWDSVKPKKDAQLCLKLLIKLGFDLYVCTASNYVGLKAKFEYAVKKNFPFIKWEQMIVTNNKQLIHGDILIDDAPHNLIGGTYEKLLMDAAHNKDFNAERAGIMRVNSWEEIYCTLCDSEKFKGGQY